MDFKAVTMVTILALLATVMQGRKHKRDTSQRATCTAPVATKGKTAVVTCHYPLYVKQPGEIVAVTVERYPLISSRTGSPKPDYLLECMWHRNFTCTLDKEQHRVEGKEVVIIIKNVNEDSQGRYLCKMMVKDGPNIHGEPCQLLVNGMNPSGPLPRTTDPASTDPAMDQQILRDTGMNPSGPLPRTTDPASTDPAMDQQILRDTDTGSSEGLGAGSVAAVVGVCVLVVVVATVFVCRKRKQRLSNSTLRSDNEDGIEGGNKQLLEEKDRLLEGKEDQHPHSDQEKPGAQSQVNEDDVNNENGQVAEPDRLVEGEEDHHPLADQERPGAQSQVNKDDVNNGSGPRQTEPGQQVERAKRQTLLGQDRRGPLGQVSENKSEECSEDPPGSVVQILTNFQQGSMRLGQLFGSSF